MSRTRPHLSTGRGEYVRVGTDVQSISSFTEMSDEIAENLKRRVFSPDEREYCESTAVPSMHYAVRWAAKEAFVKLVGGIRGFSLSDVSVVRSTDGPWLRLSAEASQALETTFDESGRVSIDLSLTHDRTTDIAAAHVVGYCRPIDR